MSRKRKRASSEIGLECQSPAVWLNDTLDVVAKLTKTPFRVGRGGPALPKQKISRFELRLQESGYEYAKLILWDRDEKKILGWLENPDVEEFLFRCLMRVVKPT